MKKIALIGGSGYIGRNLMAMLTFREGVEVIPITKHQVWSDDLGDTLKDIDVIVNCAGYVGKPNVDACEDPNVWVDLTKANAHLPKRLRTYAERNDCELVHISSGCIYQGIMGDGTFPSLEKDHKENWWKYGWDEERTPNFTGSKYSESKALGEKTLEGMEKVYVLRPRMPFCGNSTTKNLLVKLKGYKSIVDQWNSLTSVKEFCRSICSVITKPIKYGTYNLCHNIPMRNSDIIKLMIEQGYHNGEYEIVNAESFNAISKAPRSFTVLDCRKSMVVGIGMTEDPTDLIVESIHSLRRYATP